MQIKTLFAALWAASALSCASSDSAPAMRNSVGSASTMAGRVPVAMPTEGTIEGLSTYGNPIPVPGHNTWISSFVISKQTSFFRDKDPFDEGGLATQSELASSKGPAFRVASNNIRWHNAALSDRATGESWTLLQGRGFLSRWWSVFSIEDKNPVATMHVFAATIEDTNGDGFLDDKDAAVAILTDGSGRGARIVTPGDAQLSGFGLHDKQGFLTFQLRIDKDQNNKFDKGDPVRFYYLELASLGGDPREVQATPWNDPELEKRLESIYR